MRKISSIAIVCLMFVMLGLISPEVDLVKASDPPHYDSDTVMQVQLFADMKTYIEQWHPDQNNDGETHLRHWENDPPILERVIYWWNLTSIPSEAKIVDAKIRALLNNQQGSGGTRILRVYRLLENFTASEATWNDRYSGQAWTAPGGYFHQKIWNETEELPLTQGYEFWMNITYLVQNWISGKLPNYGIITRLDEVNLSESNVQVGLSKTGEFGPRLDITYLLPDLEPISFKVTPNNPMANTSVNLNVTFANDGGIDAGKFNVSFYIDDSLIQNISIAGPHHGNRSRLPIAIDYDPGNIWGNHTFRVYLNSNGSVNESNTDNNNITIDVFYIIDISQPPSASTTIKTNKWTWLGFLNATSKTGAQLYSEISNCDYVVMQNSSTGYYYTYGEGITEDFTIDYGSAVCILVSSQISWDHK